MDTSGVKPFCLQLSLTVAEGKRIIAKGICGLEEVRRAYEKGTIVLKGGTTVSAVAEELCGRSLKISGRISPRGARCAKYREKIPVPHSAVLQEGKFHELDGKWEEWMGKLTSEDIVITGANAIDVHGNAALMAGMYTGGDPGRFLQSAWIDGIPGIIAAGLEKLVAGNLQNIILQAGRKKAHRAYGMAVGLFPIFGRIFTEVEALGALARVRCLVIGKGGIQGAEGGTTFIIEGQEEEVKKIEEIYRQIQGSGISGVAESLVECERGTATCKDHRACIYK